MEPSTRKVVTRAPARTVRTLNLRGVLPHPVDAESTLEADFVRHAALYPRTRAVVSQPFKVPVSPEGYTPDYLVTTASDARIVVEVKLASKVTKYAELFDEAARYLRQRDHQFYVVTQRSLHLDRRHERAQLILRYAKASYAESDKQRALDAVRGYAGGVPMGRLRKKLNASRELLLHLIGRRLLTTGPRLAVDDSAVLSLVTTSEINDEAFFARWFDAAPWRENLRGHAADR